MFCLFGIYLVYSSKMDLVPCPHYQRHCQLLVRERNMLTILNIFLCQTEVNIIFSNLIFRWIVVTDHSDVYNVIIYNLIMRLLKTMPRPWYAWNVAFNKVYKAIVWAVRLHLERWVISCLNFLDALLISCGGARGTEIGGCA